MPTLDRSKATESTTYLCSRAQIAGGNTTFGGNGEIIVEWSNKALLY